MSNHKNEFVKILTEVADEEQVDQLVDYIIDSIEDENFDREVFIADCEDPGEDGDDAWEPELMDCVNRCLDLALNPPKPKVSPKKVNLKGLKAKSGKEEKKEVNVEVKEVKVEVKDEDEDEDEDVEDKKKPSLKIHVKSEPVETETVETKKNSPKRGTREKIHNAYHMFGFAYRPALQNKYDKKTQNQLIEQTLSNLWKLCKEDPESNQYLKEIKELGQEPHDEAYFKKQAEEHNEKAVAYNESHGFETKGRSPKKDGPKGPLNNYVVFFTEKRPEIAKANPDLKAKEIMKKVSEVWETMTDEEKKIYEEKAHEINEKEGRVSKGKKKTDAKDDGPPKKTDCYKMWQPVWKEAFKADNPEASSDLIRQKMKEAWQAVKKDKVEKKKYDKMAQEENIKRGLIPNE